MKPTTNRNITARRRFVATLASALCLPQLAFAMGSAPTPPLTLPFAANRKGAVVETELRVKEHRNYWFLLEFHFKEGDVADSNRVGLLISENYFDDETRRIRQRPPAYLHLRILEIASGTKNVVLDQEYKGYQSGGGGNGLGPYFIHAQFAAVVLKPGLYRVRVESLGNMPVLNAIPIFLHIGYYPNSTPISK